jgi:CheY-like chemotaxis protein
VRCVLRAVQVTTKCQGGPGVILKIEASFEAAIFGDVAIVLMDIMMPEMDG